MEQAITKSNNIPAPVSVGLDILTPLIENFAASYDVKASSRALYTRHIKAFFRWVQYTGRGPISAADLKEYKEALLNGKVRGADGREEKYSALTIDSQINSLRRFFAWLFGNGYISHNIAAGLHGTKKDNKFQKQPLSREQAFTMLQRSRAAGSLRNYALVNLMVRTGLRCVEVSRALIGDLTYKGENAQRVLMVQGKGRDAKDNFVILTEEAYSPIREYLNTRKDGNRPNAPLFANIDHNPEHTGKALTTRAISAIAKEAIKAIGLDGRSFTAHSLRHTAATAILDAGGTFEQAQFTLRHATPAVTQRYVATFKDRERLKNGGEYILSDYFSRPA